MAKNTVLKKPLETEEDFDFSEYLDHDHEHDFRDTSDLINGLIEADHNQMILAIELTKLVVQNTSDKSLNMDNIFSIFKNARTVIAESSPLKKLLEEISK